MFALTSWKADRCWLQRPSVSDRNHDQTANLILRHPHPEEARQLQSADTEAPGRGIFLQDFTGIELSTFIDPACDLDTPFNSGTARGIRVACPDVTGVRSSRPENGTGEPFGPTSAVQRA